MKGSRGVTIVLKGSRGALDCSPIMPRDATPPQLLLQSVHLVTQENVPRKRRSLWLRRLNLLQRVKLLAIVKRVYENIYTRYEYIYLFVYVCEYIYIYT